MKTKTLFGFVLATLIALMAVNFVAADLAVDFTKVTVNDVVVSDGTVLAGLPLETIPVVIQLVANEDLQDVKLRVWVEGYKADITASTPRFDVVNGSTYVKRFSLTLPSVYDMDSNPEGLRLYVRAYTSDDSVEVDYSVSMERESYSIDLLSVDGPSMASAGDVIALDVILKNTGAQVSEDTFVTVSIPELGISKKTYFGDVMTSDNGDSNDNEDAKERRVYLTLPANVKSGDYTIEIKASNYDTTAIAKKLISILGTAGNDSTDDGTITPTGDKDKGMPTSIIVLTVALVIVFLVLLIVLIVLLTKKPTEKSEDFGETSYY